MDYSVLSPETEEFHCVAELLPYANDALLATNDLGKRRKLAAEQFKERLPLILSFFNQHNILFEEEVETEDDCSILRSLNSISFNILKEQIEIILHFPFLKSLFIRSTIDSEYKFDFIENMYECLVAFSVKNKNRDTITRINYLVKAKSEQDAEAILSTHLETKNKTVFNTYFELEKHTFFIESTQISNSILANEITGSILKLQLNRDFME